MLRSVLLSLSLSMVSWTVLAQLGSIQGHIKDAVSSDAIVGANVMIAGTGQGAVADVNGDFQITKVKAGTYTLIVSFISYKSDTLKGITVYPDNITQVNTQLLEESSQLTEIVVSGARVRDTDVSIINDIKTSQLVVSGISAQQISLSQDRDAAQIVKRIPGVTILNNRFVNVRGLSERYSVVLLNGVIAPSTEVDSRAFAFDLVPSNMIDRMLVYKSGGANLPGDFAGAVINIETKSVVDENSLSVNVTGGVRLGTTFNTFNTTPGGSKDWLGFDDGTRSLPGSFPAKNLGSYSLASYKNRQLIGEAGAGLQNNWEANAGTAAPDLRTTINFSRSMLIGEKKLQNVTSLSYSNTRQRLQQDNYYYEAFDPSKNTKVGRRYVYNDDRDITTVRLGLISNFIFEFNPSNKIEFRNLFNQQASNQTTLRSGLEDVNNFDVKNIGINYMQRSIYTGQLVGKHSLSDRINVNWVLGYASTTADQPDYRRMRSQRAIGTTEPYAINIAPSATPTDGRFFSNLTEKIYTHTLNVDYKFKPEASEEEQPKLSLGYYLAQTERDFGARWFSYNNWAGTEHSREFLTRPFNAIFTRDNLINPEDSQANPATPEFYLNEGTNKSDAYTAKNLYTAGYVNFFIPLDKFKATIGSRVEYNKQELNSFDDKGAVKVNNPVTSILPFVNLSYNFTEKTLVRLAYSKTINRPIFRELASFNYYDFDKNANTYGNPDLKNANIHNVDLRWENYPSKSESISLGVFYKYFQDPIETNLQQGSNIIYTFINAESATNYGAEMEVRKSLANLTSSGFVDKLSFLFNAALIKSKVTMPASATNQDKERAMQGQSPYIVNAGLYYTDTDNGLQVNVSYNVFGKRIFAVGDYNQQSGVALNPTQYEMPRNQIDLTISKDLGRRFDVKVGIQDILNQKYRLIQDSNSDRKITDFDDAIQTYKPGQYITLGVTYKIN
ncbi:TonB-dependent receptor [Chryseolinea lacunae]|uniref:Carboxypeptidase-like regulatory domain-containing protein n=1 Tax=Chryseolinea lacunae TaxID=2801331 RepID=A0ABS1KR46_9BACT|nr:TonB-dependent receptor [Chryseolinea lacunae]MBL0741916.1 carboxypeptidase-like regulatory domain-containing protein [Chryseolinea lacunae]